MPTDEAAAAARPAPRLVLATIAAFWLFYFALWSVRGAAFDEADPLIVGARIIVSIASAGIMLILYLGMLRISPTRLGHSMIVAALLAIPAAGAYAVVDWFMFDHLVFHQPMTWDWMAQSGPPKSVVTGPVAPAGNPYPASNYKVGVPTSATSGGTTPLMSMSNQAGDGYFLFVAWAAIYLALCYAARTGALERRAAELRAAAQSAELRALRYQVNPHFLFNTLNSLSSLVMTGRTEQAEQMIINLATFFRTSLTGDPAEDVSLGEEILLQKLYLDIETVRFPARLIVALDIPATLETACVPGLILQPLVENAVKYGVSRTTRPVTIRIGAQADAERVSIVIEDDGDTLPAEEGGCGVGLDNVRNRLAARFGDAARCEWGPRAGGGFAARLSMPLIRHGC